MDEGVRHIEMTWKCTTCDHKNLGRYKACQSCGNVKDGSEQYEMPENPESAASVTDAALLQMATAGPDWRCAYCSSDQRRSDNSCGNCGAAIATGAEVPDFSGPDLVPVANSWWQRNGKWATRIAIGVAGLIVVIVILVWNAHRPRNYDAKVHAVAWTQSIDVERYAVRLREGFKENVPQGAMEVTSLGQRVHHHDQVLDHYDTEHYSVQVPDGYRTEYYTSRESCGQDCRSTPRSCRQSCSSSKNGFANCRTTCSGGGQSCSTRYCSVNKSRQVSKTRSEDRTRQVPKYRAEPRYAEGFSWKAWEWAHDRTVSETGGDALAMKWPSGARQTLLGGEQEREHRQAKYVVTLAYGDDVLKFEVADPQRFATFAAGTTHEIHKEEDTYTVDGVRVMPLP